MLTRARKRAQISLAPPPPLKCTVEEPPPPPPPPPTTLLSLPDVPLVEVLSYLSVEDLVRAGQASPRLGALTREHASLWRGKARSFKKYYFVDAAALSVMLRALPPVYKLKFTTVRRSPMIVVQLECFTRQTQLKAFTTLAVEGITAECCSSIIQEVTAHLEYLEISGLDRGLEFILLGLRSARLVRNLDISLETYFLQCNFSWPQAWTLPKLRHVSLASTGEYYDGSRQQRGPDHTVLQALNSLLLAHTRTVRFLNLRTLQMMPLLPLLDSRPGVLERMLVTVTVPSRPAVVLQPMSRLQDLKILSNNDGMTILKSQLVAFLESCKGSLQRLDVGSCGTQTLRTLADAKLSGLKQLVLRFDFTDFRLQPGALQAALASLPNLQSLHILKLWTPTLPEALACIPARAIPALRLLLFTDSFTADQDAAPSSDYAGFAQCQDLVRRSPMPLHVVVKVTWRTRQISVPSGERCILFFKHAATAQPDAAVCTLCTEAESALRLRCCSFGVAVKIDDRVQVQ
ncbi:uncharacterized protein LOC113211371 [Frankliniella occidentalis]|uniref:Uncharacterized protein LOC113211371 n=1 Tax=Frankliniella occidentalis TaxID=133901 RepID=A0A6J1SW69_FRAOC|nr:uncharacterized protein LOC113211371 [Frankliniella occidentalis]